jgi:hypothetical protein
LVGGPRRVDLVRTERAAQGVALPRGKPLHPGEDRAEQLVHPRETQFLLAFAAAHPEHSSPPGRGLRRGQVHQGALARSRLTDQHQHLRAVVVPGVDQLSDPRQLPSSAEDFRRVCLSGADVHVLSPSDLPPDEPAPGRGARSSLR